MRNRVLTIGSERPDRKKVNVDKWHPYETMIVVLCQVFELENYAPWW